MLPLYGLTRLQKLIPAISCFSDSKAFSNSFPSCSWACSLLETVNFDKLLAGFPRAALSLFALAVVVFASPFSSREPQSCFKCHELRHGIVPRVFGRPWDLVLMWCCCSGLFNFDCGLSWLMTAAPPGGHPVAWHGEHDLFGKLLFSRCGAGKQADRRTWKICSEEAAVFLMVLLMKRGRNFTYMLIFLASSKIKKHQKT